MHPVIDSAIDGILIIDSNGKIETKNPGTRSKKLFEAFFRAHNTGDIPGTGLGLNIVKRYAELMGGEVLCKSGVHIGTAITLRFRQ